MNKNLQKLPVAIPLVLISGIAQADFTVGGLSIEFQPRINAGAMYYEYNQSTVGVERAQSDQTIQATINQLQQQLGLTITDRLDTITLEKPFEVSTVLPTLAGGGTFFVDKFFLDVYAQHAFQSEDSASQTRQAAYSLFGMDSNNNAVGASSFEEVNERYDVDIDRTEWSISIGYAVSGHFAIYGGYKRAETALEQRGEAGNYSRRIDTVIQPPGNTGVGSTRLLKGTITRDIERDFDHGGPFIGAAYGWPIDKGFLKGALSFDLGIAFLDAEVKERQKNGTITIASDNLSDAVPREVSITDSDAIIKGDTTGLRLGFSWAGSTPLKGLSYTVGIDGYKYDFNGNKIKLNGQNFNIDTEFDETVINFRIGASYSF